MQPIEYVTITSENLLVKFWHTIHIEYVLILESKDWLLKYVRLSVVALVHLPLFHLNLSLRRIDISLDMLPTFGFDFTLTNCFKGDYLRNNKSSDVKNLRCFPRCRDACKGGHSEKGFCGNAVKGVLKIVG